MKLTFLYEKLHSGFDHFKFFISKDSCEGWKVTDLTKLLALIHTGFFPISDVHIFETHIVL